MKYLLTATLLSTFSQVASANLIANGSFEDYTVAADTTAFVATDCTGVSAANNGTPCIESTALDAWQPIAGAPDIFLEVRDGELVTFGTTNVEVTDTPFGNVYAEINPVSLTGNGFQQTFSAAVGIGDLSWYDHARGAEPLNNYKVFLNDMVNPIYDSSLFVGSYGQWTERSVSGVALLDTNVLRFVHDISGNHVTYNIDNVVLTQISAVPEPQAYLMLLAGLGLLAFFSRKSNT